ncbi:MAG: T9SS type A sorting domain-containing protein [Bacteroidia bacterium]
MQKKLLLLTVLIAIAITSYAKTIYVDIDAKGGNNGNNWNNAYTDLQDAISASKDGDEIWVAEGVYVPGNSTSDFFRMKSGVSIFGGFMGKETAQAQRNPLEYKSVLSGEIGTADKDDNIKRIMVISDLSKQIVVSGFTISDGYAEDFIASGVEIEASSPIFTWCTFENNTNLGGFSSGAAVTISNFDGEASPQFINCVFRNNECSVIGGAVHNSGDVSVFANCLFDGNKAIRGAALHNGDGIIATFNCTFVNNVADKGSTSYATGGTSTQHTNAIIWDNNNSPVMNISSSVTTLVNYCIIRGGYTGTGNINSDPKFISGTDFRLSENSPAIDKGSPSVDAKDLPSQDLAGGNRLTFSKLDLGAYEYQCKVTGTEVTLETCDEYISNGGKTYTKSGVYTEKYATKNGCDSIVTLNLTITTADSTISQTACSEIEINGKTYTSSGTYYQKLETTKGCDSLLTLELTIYNINNDVNQSGNTLTAVANNATYQWLNCDDNNAPIAGETGKSFTATEDGNYAVEITKNGCSKISDCVELTPSSIGESISNLLSFYPNPATAKLVIEQNSPESMNYHIYSADGRLVDQGILNHKTNIISVAGLDKGVYLIQTKSGVIRFTKM